jgi:hypothetical protein
MLLFAALLVIGGMSMKLFSQRTMTESQYRQMQEHLEQNREWLLKHPPNGKNREVRRQRIQLIQVTSEFLSASTYMAYLRAWTHSEATADTLEQQHLTLAYLRMAIQRAIQDIRATQVQQGIAVWYLYNMGYVFKTPHACFGIDLHARDAAMLADDLDFLLVTHGHRDHVSTALFDAMIAADKPVVTRGYPGSLVVKKSTEFTFGTIRVKVDIGDHHRHLPIVSWNNMLMFQIDVMEGETRRTIYHSGDGNRFSKMQPDRPVDLFIVHVQLPMDVGDAIAYLSPKQTIISHVLELSHSAGFPLPLRWSFDFAFDEVAELDEQTTLLLTWGERWMFPGTVLEAHGERIVQGVDQ